MSRRAAYRHDHLLPVLGTCPQPHKIGYNLGSVAQEALSVTRSAAEAGVAHRREQRVYECSCGMYHLTSEALVDREVELAKEPLYIPQEGSSLADVVPKGSGVWASWRGGGSFLIDFEDGSCENVATFADRIRQARDRQIQDLPTDARITARQESLVFIGHYDDGIGSVELLEDSSVELCWWLGVDSVDRQELNTTDPTRTTARASINEEMMT